MIIGAHSIIYSTNPDADRAVLRDVLRLTNVDVGEGWLIFGLPPAEVAVHPSDENDRHEFHLMCDDVGAFVRSMQDHGLACSEIQDAGWGRVTLLTLPGGGKLGVYQPLHARPRPMGAGSGESKKRPAAAEGGKKPAGKAPARRKAKKVRSRAGGKRSKIGRGGAGRRSRTAGKAGGSGRKKRSKGRS